MSSSQSTKTLLITGATGYVGFHVLVQALAKHWNVKLAVRSISAAKDKIFSTGPFKEHPEYADQLSFIEVQDILATGAYDDAVKGVTHVIHCASPIAYPHFTDFEKEILQPAVKGTISILESAAKEPAIKRVIITSSTVATRSLAAIPEEVTTAGTRIPAPKGPFNSAFEAYAASKITALHEAEAWIQDHKLPFDTIFLMPGAVIGRNELAKSPQELLMGTAAFPITHLVMPEYAMPLGGQAVDIQDVAFVHVAALEPEIQGNRSYGLSSIVTWSDSWSIIEEQFPREVEQGIFKKGSNITYPGAWDASESELIFEFKFTPFRDSVISVAKQWVELVRSA